LEGKGSTFWFWIDFDKSFQKDIIEIRDHSHQQIDKKPMAEEEKKTDKISSETKKSDIKTLAAKDAKLESSENCLKVLLAEDNQINQKVAKMHLEKLGHQVETADNGKIALDMFTKNQYDMIFMDVQMPEMDGIESTKRIREFEHDVKAKKPIIIVALTANAMKGDKEACLNAGMNDYMSKPFKPQELKSILDAIVEKKLKE
jgi:CheY-like chemotaxis protein